MTQPIPLAYLITFTCYGTRLHGNAYGSVDREHNTYGTPFLPPDKARLLAEEKSLMQAPYELDCRRRELVLAAVREICSHRRWSLW
ncbi:MAG: hypothetical protein HY647_13920, partial [Acidobacteria bacterium]|nr:hypothetical protein [Acidobacteriota bacterium]